MDKDWHLKHKRLCFWTKNEDLTMENKHWSTHIEFVVLFVTLIGGFYLLDGKIEKQSARTDSLYESLQVCMVNQSQRSDKLYEMFIEIVKEKKHSDN